MASGIAAVARGEHSDPFQILGPHGGANGWVVRCLLPHAEQVMVVDAGGAELARGERVDEAGVFEAQISAPRDAYRLRARVDGHWHEIDDPYRFPSPLGELDRHLIGEGSHQRLFDVLGARVTRLDGVTGVHFAVWAPNARRVSVVGPFNDWDGRRHPMRPHPANGVWDLFIPALEAGALYKFEIIGPAGERLPLKADPMARRMEPPPGNASVVHTDRYAWRDETWMRDARPNATTREKPVSIYEVHLGSWRRHLNSARSHSYDELASGLVDYVKEMGFTHIELMPVQEHPFDGSWGYQPIGLYAPTWRFGSPDAFKHLVDVCHRAGIGVILDWVPAHFPRDDFGLARFDGTCLYEHADPRQGEHPDWGTLVYNLGRAEVANFLIANALWWVDEYHIDALRVDAVASMLYLDYSREPRESGSPTSTADDENLAAIAFLRRHSTKPCYEHYPSVRSRSPRSRPHGRWCRGRPGADGLGLRLQVGHGLDARHACPTCQARPDPPPLPPQRDHLSHCIYAFNENFMLPLSHDEVVHGKGSLHRNACRATSGNASRTSASCYGYHVCAQPGKKLLFMGAELAQWREWSVDRELDWHLLEQPLHGGVQRLVRDLNALYRELPALHARDCEQSGFEWIDCEDRDVSVITFLRRGERDHEVAVVACNFTPVVRENYRVGVPLAGEYRERLNSDAETYGGSGIGNHGSAMAEPVFANGHAQSLCITLPPLASVIFSPAVNVS